MATPDLSATAPAINTPTTISRALAEYLTDWLAWVDRGAPDGEPYYRCDGLCVSAFRVPARCDELLDELGELFDAEAPFGGVSDYFNRCAMFTQHLNEARLAWVRSTLATAEITE